jgi:hypothetical protein
MESSINPFPGGIYYDSGGMRLLGKVGQNVERETGGSTKNKIF